MSIVLVMGQMLCEARWILLLIFVRKNLALIYLHLIYLHVHLLKTIAILKRAAFNVLARLDASDLLNHMQVHGTMQPLPGSVQWR